MNKTYYITTPIYYVNGEPHIGTAYTTVVADVLSRYFKMLGREVFFLTGTDEHGQKIYNSAKERGLEPKQFADSMITKFKETWELLNIKYDHFIRTTDSYHEKAVRHFFKTLLDKGDIYLGEYSGWYCTPCESYVTTEEEICPTCNRNATWLEEENYFFALSKYQDTLLKHLERNKTFIRPESRYNEILYRVKDGLRDVSVSRKTLKWGISMPTDESHVIWVWFDALLNYVSACGYPDEKERFSKIWPADLHLIAKDILWFHCVIWPCMLIANNLPLPQQIFAHGWWTMNSEKISKSKGNIVYPKEAVNLFGRDALRYFLLREITFGLDGDFSYSAISNKYNSDLADDLGNLLQRTVVMTEKYFNGKVPQKSAPAGEEVLIATFQNARSSFIENFSSLNFSVALENLWQFVKLCNKYVEDSKPWLLAKEPNGKEKLKTVIYSLLEGIRNIAVMIYPVMPETSEEIYKQLGLEFKKDFSFEKDCQWNHLKGVETIKKGKSLFPKKEVD